MTTTFKIHLAVLLLSTVNVANTADLPPLRLRDQGKSVQMRVREYGFKDYTKIGIQHSLPCRIKYVDRYFGYLDDADYYHAGKMPFQSVCYDIDTPDLFAGAPVRYDEDQKQWVRDLSVALRSWDSGDGLRPDEVLAIDDSIRVYALTNANSQGFAYTVEPWTGDERGRTRQLDYCLFRAKVALCGHGDMGALVEGPMGDLTSYTLQLLRSIEFLPDASPAASASAPQR